jgi:hypothetical protein
MVAAGSREIDGASGIWVLERRASGVKIGVNGRGVGTLDRVGIFASIGSHDKVQTPPYVAVKSLEHCVEVWWTLLMS